MALTKTEIAALRTLRRRLGGDTGKLSFAGGGRVIYDAGQVRDVADLINQETRIWRQTWILPVLNALIAKGEGRATSEDDYAIKYAAKLL